MGPAAAQARGVQGAELSLVRRAVDLSEEALPGKLPDEGALPVLPALQGLLPGLRRGSVVAAGPRGVGWAALVVEMAGAVAGWAMLAKVGAAPTWPDQTGRALVGCLGLVAACRLTRGAPLPLVSVAPESSVTEPRAAIRALLMSTTRSVFPASST